MNEDRKFGMVLTLVLALFGFIFCWKGRQGWSVGFLSAGIVSLGLTIFLPGAMGYPQRFLRAVGWFNSRLILVLVYYLVFTPSGLLMRLVGRDPLRRKWKKKESYWIPREPIPFEPEGMERQY